MNIRTAHAHYVPVRTVATVRHLQIGAAPVAPLFHEAMVGVAALGAPHFIFAVAIAGCFGALIQIGKPRNWSLGLKK